MRSRNWLLLILLVVLSMRPGIVLAAKQLSPKGIGINPFLQQVTITPEDEHKTFTLSLTNHTAAIQEIGLQTRDFGSLNETGGILLEGINRYSEKYGLASWLTLEKDAVVLDPGASATVETSIDNRTSLQPGGHYGAIVTTVNTKQFRGGNKVLVNQQLLSLVLATKQGGEKYDLKLTSAAQNGNWIHLPKIVKLRYRNPGNVHVIPRGIVRLQNPTGKTVASGVINSESAFVLPESYRELYVPLHPVSAAIPWPGLYHIDVEYRYEGFNHSAHKRFGVKFISLGMYLLSFLLLIIVLSVLKYRRKKS